MSLEYVCGSETDGLGKSHSWCCGNLQGFTFTRRILHLPGGECACPIGTVIDVLLLQDSVLQVCPPRNLPH